MLHPSEQAQRRQVNNGHGLLVRDGREAVDGNGKRVAGAQVVEEVLNRHAGVGFAAASRV